MKKDMIKNSAVKHGEKFKEHRINFFTNLGYDSTRSERYAKGQTYGYIRGYSDGMNTMRKTVLKSMRCTCHRLGFSDEIYKEFANYFYIEE